jgi:hypothetical protein
MTEHFHRSRLAVNNDWPAEEGWALFLVGAPFRTQDRYKFYWDVYSKGLTLSDVELKDLEVSYNAEESLDMRNGGRMELCTFQLQSSQLCSHLCSGII